MFSSLNYSVLAIDNRGHGESGGKHITMGHKDCQDVSLWVDYLTNRFKDCEIVVFGLSMGGATVCLYSELQKPKNVKLIISDCAYSNAYEVFNSVSKSNFFLRVFSIMPVYDHYLKHRAGYRLSEVKVDDAIKNCNVPILLIHGSKDNFVPFYMHQILYDNCPQNLRKKHVIENVGHAESLPTKPDEYKKVVVEFLDSYIS